MGRLSVAPKAPQMEVETLAVKFNALDDIQLHVPRSRPWRGSSGGMSTHENSPSGFPRIPWAQSLVGRVEQFEGDPGLPPLGVQVGAVRDGPMVGGLGRGPVHPGLQRLVGEGVDLGPVEPGRPRPALDGRHGAEADP